jgi:hypothetical protein
MVFATRRWIRQSSGRNRLPELTCNSAAVAELALELLSGCLVLSSAVANRVSPLDSLGDLPPGSFPTDWFSAHRATCCGLLTCLIQDSMVFLWVPLSPLKSSKPFMGRLESGLTGSRRRTHISLSVRR